MTKEELAELELTQKTLLKLSWADITDDTVGDPDEAHLTERHTYALFWSLVEDEVTGIDCMVLTYTDDPDVAAQQGWLCVPLDVISEVEVVRRPRKSRKKKEEVVVATVQTRRTTQGATSADADRPKGGGGGV